ncbi:MAG: phage tail assembly protein [Lachnospiraceae bacterium]|nr:phage tail assembly protein [Lachnospiraceae bacterium]
MDKREFEAAGKEQELKGQTQAPEKQEPAITAAAAPEPEEENKYLIKFRKPFVWEDNTYTEIDMSGLEDLSARDMIAAQRTMEKSGSINVLPEMSLEYACIFASKATKMPVEFFQALPPKEAIKVKNKVTNFFYGED